MQLGGALEWRSLFEGRPVEAATYHTDVVGPLEPFDERDNLFARIDLQPGTESYQTYYAAHPEFEPVDAFLRGMSPLGSTAAPADASAMAALFATPLAIGRPMPSPPSQGTVASGRAKSRVVFDPVDAARRVKSLARSLGADLVGIAAVNPAFVYSHAGRCFYAQDWGEEIGLSHPFAISLGFAMDYDLLRRYAPGFPTMLESGFAYARAAVAAVQLARYVEGLGYSARAHHLRDYQLLSVPVAIDAGLGELGRSGVLITREFGSSLRLATVTTDLPLSLDRPVDLGIQQFCNSCKLCVMGCPAGAIPGGEKIALRGVKRWKLAAGRCYHYWRQASSDCSLCIVACPWSRPDNITRPLRPTHPQPNLDPATVAEVRRIRATLPAWLQRYLDKP